MTQYEALDVLEGGVGGDTHDLKSCRGGGEYAFDQVCYTGKGM